jgi:endo-1,4-beta-xylanase
VAIDRRAFLCLLAAAGTAAGRGAAQQEQPSELPSLRDAAAARGLRYGATPETDLSMAPPAYGDLFARQCGLLAPVLPWSASPRPGVYEFAPSAGNLAFAAAHRLELTGSHLLWHEWVPTWFAAISRPAEAERVVVEHVRTMAARFAGQVYSWNVVNEAIDVRDGTPDGLRRSPFLEKLGPGFIDLAFRVARNTDPAALLLYNDNDLEAALPEHEARRRALLGLLDRLARLATPLDGVGLQCHLRLAHRFDGRRFGTFLAEIADRGLKIVISELDVLDVGAPAQFAVRDRLVADRYAELLSVALDNRAVAAVVTWGLSDRYTWLGPRQDRPFRRADDLPPRPLPFDADFRPKPVYRVLLEAFLIAPARRPSPGTKKRPA